MSPITLYTAKICPYAHRVEIALVEAKADFKCYQIDLKNKPEWFAPRVNPASKVPAIAYGGLDVPPEDPDAESVKLIESLVLVEFVADLFPESNLLPKDPVLRAKIRYFIGLVSTKFVPAFHGFLAREEGYQALLAATQVIQDNLPERGDYALGDQFTIADIAIAPFLDRLIVASMYELGKFPFGQGGEFLQALSSEKYAKFCTYVEHLLDRESNITTFDPEYVRNSWWICRG